MISRNFKVLGLAACASLFATAAAFAAPNFSQVGFSTVAGGTSGGAGGPVVDVSSASAFKAACGSGTKETIRVMTTIHLSGDINVASNKSIIGHGTAGALTGGGLVISGNHNVIIQNLHISGVPINDITVENHATHVWIDHCLFGSAVDTMLDIKRGADFVTVSWNEFRGPQDEVVLQGHSDSNGGEDIGHLRTTYHHNYFHNTNQRHPRIRFAQTHVFNNYESHLAKYGVASTCNASVLLEANYFNSVPQPDVSQEGSSPSGNIKVTADNIRVNSGGFVNRGTVFNPRTYYNYTPDSASSLPTIVPQFSGVGKTGQ